MKRLSIPDFNLYEVVITPERPRVFWRESGREVRGFMMGDLLRFTLRRDDGYKLSVSAVRVACLALRGYPPTDANYFPHSAHGDFTQTFWMTASEKSKLVIPQGVDFNTRGLIADAYVKYVKKHETRYGARKAIASQFGIDRTTVDRILREMHVNKKRL